MRRESPNEYIKWHAPEEAVNEERLKLAHEALSKPIGKVEYSDSGDSRIENAPFLVEFSYATVSKDTAKLFSGNPHHKGVDPSTLRELTSWKLTRTDKNISLTLSNILPGGYKVFFSPINQDWSSYIVMDNNRGMVVLSGDITMPEMIIHLMHEAGHVHEKTDDARFSSINEHDASLKVYVGDLAETLLSERNAWAFGLKKLKPFLEKNKSGGFSIQQDDVLTVVKNQALQSYHGSIKDDTAGRVAMSHFNQDYDYMFEDTDKWD